MMAVNVLSGSEFETAQQILLVEAKKCKVVDKEDLTFEGGCVPREVCDARKIGIPMHGLLKPHIDELGMKARSSGVKARSQFVMARTYWNQAGKEGGEGLDWHLDGINDEERDGSTWVYSVGAPAILSVFKTQGENGDTTDEKNWSEVRVEGNALYWIKGGLYMHKVRLDRSDLSSHAAVRGAFVMSYSK